VTKPAVVFVGHTCIDHNISEHARYTSWGSPALYMSDYLQSHRNITPDILTTYGRDLLPYTRQFSLHPSTPNTVRTMVYENITNAEGRTQYCKYSRQATPPVLDEASRKLLSQADILVVAPLAPNYPADYVRELLDAVPSSCLKVCCPQGYFREVHGDGTITPREFVEAEGLVSRFDLVLLSEEDHPTATEQALAWKKQAPRTHIIVTQGPRGAALALDSQLSPVPTKPIKQEDIVDSVGCGDVFSAAVMCEYRQTNDIVQSIKAGHIAAREKLLSVNQAATAE
jgi:sugar/nucleoside kinase (ribokinase family)